MPTKRTPTEIAAVPRARDEQPKDAKGSITVRGLYVVEQLFVAELAREHVPWSLNLGEEIDPPATWPDLSHMTWQGSTLYYYNNSKKALGKSVFEIFADFGPAMLHYLHGTVGWAEPLAAHSTRLYAIERVSAQQLDGEVLIDLLKESVRLKINTVLYAELPTERPTTPQ
jgi:hypothetical protein